MSDGFKENSRPTTCDVFHLWWELVFPTFLVFLPPFSMGSRSLIKSFPISTSVSLLKIKRFSIVILTFCSSFFFKTKLVFLFFSYSYFIIWKRPRFNSVFLSISALVGEYFSNFQIIINKTIWYFCIYFLIVELIKEVIIT